MALFQRQPQAGDTIKYYTLGQNNTLLIVGLGNPGREYDGTRHNIGFACLDFFAARNDFDPWIDKKNLKCHLTSQTMSDTRVILIKPTTFMNLSGEAVQAVMNFYKIAVDHVLAVYDEIDIDFGQIRNRVGGSAAGHNGVKSLIQHVGEQCARIRVGIGPKTPDQLDSAAFVLQKFNQKELEHLPELLREVNAILTEYVFGSGQLPHETRSFMV